MTAFLITIIMVLIITNISTIILMSKRIVAAEKKASKHSNDYWDLAGRTKRQVLDLEIKLEKFRAGNLYIHR